MPAGKRGSAALGVDLRELDRRLADWPAAEQSASRFLAGLQLFCEEQK